MLKIVAPEADLSHADFIAAVFETVDGVDSACKMMQPVTLRVSQPLS